MAKILDETGLGKVFSIVKTNFDKVAPKYASLTIPTTGWSGSGPWTRTVSITGGTASSMVDIQSSDAVINTMIESGTTALFIKNDSGVFTLVAIGAIPNAAVTLQVSITEVKPA